MKKVLALTFILFLASSPSFSANTPPPGLPGNILDNGGSGKTGAIQLAPNSLLGAVTSNSPIPIIPRNNLTLTTSSGATYLDAGSSSGSSVSSFAPAGSTHQWGGLYVIGDYISDNADMTPVTNGWGQIVANQIGTSPTYYLTPSNNFNEYTCDIINSEVLAAPQPTSGMNIPYALFGSILDATWGNGNYSGHLTDTISCVTGALTWLATPVQSKVYAQALSGVTTSGAWVKDPSYTGYFGYTTSESGDAMALTTTTYGGSIYLWYQMNANNGGTFTANVDGVLSSTTTVLTQGTNNISYCGSACGQSLGAVRLAVTTTGSHTVNIDVLSATSTANTVTIEGIGTSPITPYSSKQPVSIIASTLSISSASYVAGAMAAFSSAFQTIAAQGLADGLGTLYANIPNYNIATDVTSYFGGGTSFNNSAQNKIAAAFAGILQPVRSVDGSIDPRDYGSSCNTQFYTQVNSNHAWQVSTTSGSNVIGAICYNNGASCIKWQPGVATPTGGGDVGKRICIFGGDYGNVAPCTYIASVNTSNNTATIGQLADVSDPVSGYTGGWVMYGGYPINPNDPSTAIDDTVGYNAAQQAAIFGGNKVHMPTGCMLHGALPASAVLTYGDTAGQYYQGGSLSTDGTTPASTTMVFCGLTTIADDTQTCINVAQAPWSKFKDMLMVGMTDPYYMSYGYWTTAVALGYANSSGSLGPNGNIFTENMNYFGFPIDVGQAMGFQIKKTFIGQASGLSLTVSSFTSSNINAIYNQWPTTDVLALGSTISGIGIPANETIVSTPRGAASPGVFGLSLTVTSTTAMEAMSTIANANVMSIKDTNSQYINGGIGINGSFSDSAVDHSICTGTNIDYCWYLGPDDGNNAGNGGNRWTGGRLEEAGQGGSHAAIACDSCQIYFDGVDFDFNTSPNIVTKQTNGGRGNDTVQVTGGNMIAGGHCAGGQNAMILVGGGGTTVSVDGVLLGTNDYGSGCGGTTSYLFVTATGVNTGATKLSVSGGNAASYGVGSYGYGGITNLYNWVNGAPKYYRQSVAGFPFIDTFIQPVMSGLAMTSTSGGIASGGGLAAVTTSTATLSFTGLNACPNGWTCAGGDAGSTPVTWPMSGTTTTSCSLNATTTNGDPVYWTGTCH